MNVFTYCLMAMYDFDSWICNHLNLALPLGGNNGLPSCVIAVSDASAIYGPKLQLRCIVWKSLDKDKNVNKNAGDVRPCGFICVVNFSSNIAKYILHRIKYIRRIIISSRK